MLKNFMAMCLLGISIYANAQTRGIISGNLPRSVSFNQNWQFLKDSAIDAAAANFDDSKWRKIQLPHDWSIEDLPNQKEGIVQGPFTKASIGKAATGFTEGGIGWYRKKFTLDKSYEGKQTYITFDGVYNSADVWVNGRHIGNHHNGYTAFSYDLTQYLNPVGKQNVLAVRVKNIGKNSRWYTGSGIYRHVWLTPVNKVHTELDGIYVTTPTITPQKAQVNVETAIKNASSKRKTVDVQVEVVHPTGKIIAIQKKSVSIPANSSLPSAQQIQVSSPAIWSLENPSLYTARVKLIVDGKAIDETNTSFGIRSLRFDGEQGFMLNGKVVKLKGGCIHHDHGPLGTASFDRAEERKIELLKNAGYNAIRLSHNPVAKALLDACDRLGMMVVTDAYDSWEKQKLTITNGYHNHFRECWQRDIEAMIKRDRNHPSIIMWGIGNEIFEAADTSGHRIAKQLADAVRRLDSTRAITEAIIYMPQSIKHSWEEYQPHLANLDVDGYNYFIGGKLDPMQRDSATNHRHETEHARNPHKLYMATEYYPSAALENWAVAERFPYFIGGFSWTAMDYIGEANIGGPALVPESTKVPEGLMSLMFFFKPESWPVFNANSGDLDLIGNRKAASYYQNVVWRNSPIEMLVHRPIRSGMKEIRSPWGFPDELKSWTWPGEEGKKMQVNVYTRSKVVRLELNGKTIAEQSVPEGSITATFEVDYQPGTLTAKGFDGEKESGASTLSTTGKPAAIRLVADRTSIKANGEDLSYVSVDVVDENGAVVPYVDDVEIAYQINGEATLAAVGNGNPADMSSFQQPKKKAYQGRGLAIVRSTGKSGTATLVATAKGLAPAQVVITTR